MQDPNEDTEWNDILRAKGIIPEKPKENEIQEEDIIAMMDAAIKEKSGGKSTIFFIFQKKNLESSNTKLQSDFFETSFLFQFTFPD